MHFACLKIKLPLYIVLSKFFSGTDNSLRVNIKIIKC